VSAKRLLFAVCAQTRLELTLTLRRGESLLVTLVIPVVLLLFFASSRVLPGGGAHIDFLLPGTVALAVISTGLVSLGIATAYERYYRVLKRLGSTPFPRVGLVTSKLLAVIAFEAAQIGLLVAVACIAYGWRPNGSPTLAVGAILLGTAAFAGLGLAMAGALRAEATLAAANALFLFFLLLGDLYVPLDHLPSWVESVSKLLPAAALAEVLRSALTRGAPIPLQAAVVLLIWAVAGPLLAVMTFRWE
jgi:ABC-2 type transport system permease protein